MEKQEKQVLSPEAAERKRMNDRKYQQARRERIKNRKVKRVEKNISLFEENKQLKELNGKLSIENLNLKSKLLSAENSPSLKILGSIKFFATTVVLPLLIIAFGVTLGGIILEFLYHQQI